MSGYFRTCYARTSRSSTRTQKAWFAFWSSRLAYPFGAGPLGLELANQVLLGSIGAVALMLLTGYAGQISLGHAGCSPPARSPPASCSRNSARRCGSRCRFGSGRRAARPVFGLPSLRLRGLYLAVSTLALHFIVIFLGGEYETKRGFSTGIVIESPSAARAPGTSCCSPRPRPRCFWRSTCCARAPGAPGAPSTAAKPWPKRSASACRAPSSAFVVSSTLTAVAGCLFAYYRGFVSAEAFSLYLTIQYVAMIIIGGMGSLLGAVLGTVFVVLFPYAIDGSMAHWASPSAFRRWCSP